jgi:hypothetical protein
MYIVVCKESTNAQIRKRTNRKDIVAVTQNLKWRWGGHEASRDQCIWAEATFIW